MKFITSVLLTALLSFVLGLYLPWWSLAIAAFAVAALIFQKPWHAFLSGFLALFLLNIFFASAINAANDGILAGKVARIFPLGGSAILLILISALIGALVAGLAALSGRYLRYIL
ncbi:MAG TPA: hypothetical protein VM012_03245 [Flavitalea sp.]|nr:hypothetical protein [Flavitalea sp.]